MQVSRDGGPDPCGHGVLAAPRDVGGRPIGGQDDRRVLGAAEHLTRRHVVDHQQVAALPGQLGAGVGEHVAVLVAGLGREGLRVALAEAGVPGKQLRMRVNQLYSWLYVRGVSSFDAMTDVAKELRAELSQRALPTHLARVEVVPSALKEDAPSIGAASLVLHELMSPNPLPVALSSFTERASLFALPV